MKHLPVQVLFGWAALTALVAGGAGCGATEECATACPTSMVCLGGSCVAQGGTPDGAASDGIPGVTSEGGAGDGGAGEGGAGDGPVGDGPGALDSPMDAAPTVTSLAFSPPTATLTARNGSTPAIVFMLTATYSDGTTKAAKGATFSLDPANLGTFTPDTLLFISNGVVGGAGTLKATLGGASAQAALTVQIEQAVLVAGTPPDALEKFSAAAMDEPKSAATIVYPLDGAVMPQNVAPADVQWENSATGDYFRISMRKPNVRIAAYTAYVTSPNDDWVVEDTAWRRIAQSDPDAWAEIVVDRYEAATKKVWKGQPVKIRFARAALLGATYYWDITAGRILRIPDGATKAESFLPKPPRTGGEQCIGCHAVSQSGRYMAGRLGSYDNPGAVFDLTKDLTADPAPTVFPVSTTAPGSIRWVFASFGPDDTRMVVSQGELGGADPMALRIVDPMKGTPVTVEGTLPTGRVTHPAWSPDGKAIAFVKTTDRWGGENQTGDLWSLPVTGPDKFGEAKMILAGASLTNPFPAGVAASYPSWTPDSKFLAFAHGSSSRSENGRSALYLVQPDGAGVVRLGRASGGDMGAVSFQPRFSPFRQGGYFWLSLLTRRDYGNAKAGTKGRGELQQIWVSAIKDNPKPGEDPSEVPYWLPGQSHRSRNISAFWAARACQSNAEACKVDAECCSGECEADAAGKETCVALTQCRPLGGGCTDSKQCCEGLLCVGNTCGGVSQSQ